MIYLFIGILILVLYKILRGIPGRSSIDNKDNDPTPEEFYRSICRSMKKCGRSTLSVEDLMELVNNTYSNRTVQEVVDILSKLNEYLDEKIVQSNHTEEVSTAEYCDIIEQDGRVYAMKNGSIIEDITESVADLEVIDLTLYSADTLAKPTNKKE